MKDNYQDILDLVGNTEVVWYDIHGVPRFSNPPTVPLHLLGRIRCQNCGKEFWVSLTDNVYHQAGIYRDGICIAGDSNVELDPEEHARLTNVHSNGLRVVCKETYQEYHACKHLRLKQNWRYGDPPFHGYCVGETMNSIPEYEWQEYFDENGNRI